MQFIQNYHSRFRILKGGKISLVVSALLGSEIIANAAPTAGVVTSGTATISQNGNTTNINQTTSKASINWQNFNIASNETVNFNQPNKNSITLNRVIGNEKSVIDGALNANGHVWILNSNGILFSKDAKINTSGLVATTAELSDKDFQDGNYNFKNSKSNSVVNLGTIEVSEGGYVVLASNEVKNSGTIKAIKGKVFLSGNSEYTINLNGNSIVNLIVTKGLLDAMVENSGTIVANGGEIYLTTNAVNELLKGVVNNTGILEANSLDELTGKVELFSHGGTANVGGEIKAEGGFVETSGKDVKIADDFKVKAKEWLIDPLNFTITSGIGSQTSSSIGATTLSNNLATTSVVIQTTNGSGSGDIFVNSAISWSSDKSLTLNAHRNIYINSDITATNAIGKLNLYYGQASADGGTADNYTLAHGVSINLQDGQNFSTQKGTAQANLKNFVVISTLGSSTDINTGTSLQGIKTNDATVLYALGTNIDASATSTWNSNGSGGYYGFSPIGNGTNNFLGTFDGLGHIINNLYINRPTEAYVGFFGAVGSSSALPKINNIGITNANIVGGAYVGILAGNLDNTTINNSWTSGTVESKLNISTTTTGVGGLIGTISSMRQSFIYNSYSSASVTSSATNGYNLGGLIGLLSGAGSEIKYSYATGSVTGNTSTNAGGLVGKSSNCVIDQSYSSGNVSANFYVGGFIGSISLGMITNTYATGNVSATDYAGGYAGFMSTAQINTAYSTGSVNNVTHKGGFVGWLSGATNLSNCFWNTQTSGISSDTSGVTVGKSSSEMQSSTFLSTLNGSNSYWKQIGGTGYSTFRTILLPITITLTGNLTKTYGDINPTISYTSSDNSAVTLNWGNAMTQWTNAGTYAFSSTPNIVASVYATGTASDYAITWDYGSYSITINPYTLSLANFAASDKIYNGTNAAIVSGTLGTALNGDTVNLTGTFVDKNVANGKIVTAVLSNANYTLGATPITTTANITPKTITISGLTSVNKVYDGLTSATLNGTAALQSETVGTGTSSDGNTYTEDTVNLIGTATGIFDNKNVATGKTVNITGLTLTGTDAGNYTLSGATTTADITAKAITFSAPDVTKTYDGGLTYTATAGELTALGSSLTSGDTLTSITLAYADKNAGTDNKTVNASSAVINDGNNGNNYSVTYVSNNTSTITPKTVSLSAANQKINISSITNVPVVNSTMPTTQAQIHLPVKSSVNLSQNVMQNNSNNLTVPNIVSTPMESEATKMVTLSEVRSMQTTNVNETQSDDKNEIKVALSAYSGIKLVNGGVNLPLGVEQLFYVTEDKRK